MSNAIRLAKLGFLAGAMVAASAAHADKGPVKPGKSTIAFAKKADKDRRGNAIGIGGGRPDRPGKPAEHPRHPDHPEHPRSPK